MLIKSYIVTSQGPRQYMEDTYVIKKIQRGIKSIEFLGIFDGHGGIEVAALCRDNMPLIFDHVLNTCNGDMMLALKRSFRLMDEFVKLKEKRDTVGSTAVLTVLTDHKCWFANAGDSMTMLMYKNGKSHMVSQEHKAESEKDRILKSGGILTYWDGMGRVNGTLNLSRSIGDHYIKKHVISTPFITHIDINKLSEVQCIVMASDGIWDVYDHTTLSNDIRKLLNNDTNVDVITRNIVTNAYKRGSTDNITLVISVVKV